MSSSAAIFGQIKFGAGGVAGVEWWFFDGGIGVGVDAIRGRLGFIEHEVPRTPIPHLLIIDLLLQG